MTRSLASSLDRRPLICFDWKRFYRAGPQTETRTVGSAVPKLRELYLFKYH